uniref:Uncharacterized protein UP6 n=1 Tax=Coprinellus disseminatus TaxID=71703 RepID=Q1WMT4_COPDI|nr:conserved hypothetical protein [Coprinellus disseminatus]
MPSAYAQLYIAPGSSGITATLGSLLRPDIILSRMRSNSSLPKAIPPDQEAQPIPQTVSLLPVYEFMAGNANFRRALLSDLDDPTKAPSWIGSFLNLASWLLTNASSTSSARTMSYASLTLEMILVLVEDEDLIGALSSRSAHNIHLCQQRQPKLRAAQPNRPLLCDILDCCNLWLRHNLHRRIAVHSYSKCIWICPDRVVFAVRAKYHWEELWHSVIGLFSFLATKFDTLMTTGGIGQLVLDGLSFLEAAIASAETYLPTPSAVHELVYEIVRNSSVLEKQQDILSFLQMSPHDQGALRYVVDVTSHYEEKISATGANLKDASDAMRIIVREVERDGLYRPANAAEQQPR